MCGMCGFVVYRALSHALSHLIPTIILSGRYYCSSFTDEETVAQRITNPGSHSKRVRGRVRVLTHVRLTINLLFTAQAELRFSWLPNRYTKVKQMYNEHSTMNC